MERRYGGRCDSSLRDRRRDGVSGASWAIDVLFEEAFGFEGEGVLVDVCWTSPSLQAQEP